MSITDKLVQLDSIKKDIKSAITGKGQTVNDDMTAYASAISSIAPTLQTKTVTPKTTIQTVTADSGYDGLESVSVGAISTETMTVTHSRSEEQVITPSTGKYISKVTVPRAVGVTPIYRDSSTSVGSTKTYTIVTTIDPPETTSRGMSQMSTLFVVTVADDDLIQPICFPFTIITTEEDLSSTTVYPTTGYSQLCVPSDSANYDCFETTVTLSVASYAVTDEGVGAATIQVTVTTESTSAEYDCAVYRVDRFTY